MSEQTACGCLCATFTSSIWTHTFLFLDMMFLNVVFSAFLDNKYFTVGMDDACLVPAKEVLCLREDFRFFNDTVMPFFKTSVISMQVEPGQAWRLSEILPINNHNGLTQNASVPTQSE